ncbi:MAG TPA: nuclear transport factor 2 family protein [Pyrinomonadaceae bacterium]|nr:nuclear transport factor 2 family protein [Pyrinomonadaceae bacterium]
MQKMTLVTATFLLITLASISAYAQNTEKKDGEKPTASTVDAWRSALPQSEQTSDTPPAVVMEESRDNVESRETEAEIEKRVLDLQFRLMEAFKKRDSVALNQLLADDFMPVGVNITESQSDKTRYIQSALKNSEFKSYTVEKAVVRAYRTTAIVTVRYKQQSIVGGVPSDANFIATDVWVKRGKQWQAVSRHLSQLSKP